MKRKVFRLLLILALIVVPIAGITIDVDAASDLTLGTLISDSPNDRLFTVKNNSGNSVRYVYQTSTQNNVVEKTIAAYDSDTIRVAANSSGQATLTVKQIDDPNAVSQIINSLNQYYVTINFVDSNGMKIADSRQAVATYNSGCSYTASSSLSYNGDVYDLTGNNYVAIPYGNTSYTFTYSKRAQPNFTSKVILVDQDGTTHKTIEYTVNEDTGGSVTVPETFVSTINGRTYKIMSGYSTKIKQSYSQGVMQTVVRYQVQEDETSKPYNIFIQYIDKETNNVLLTKTLLVQKNKTVEHNPSSSFMKNGLQYQLVDGNKITHSFGDSQRNYQVYYKQLVSDETTPQPLQVNYVDLATGNILEIHEYTVDPGKNKTITLDSSFDYDGTTYILNSAQQDYVEGNKITHKFGHNITEYNVYYTEKGVEINSYEVSITYMDVSHTNVGEKTLYTTKVTANVNEALSIDVEQQFQANGTTYVLLPGQESHYDHDFYSTRRNYVMVYRDINDTNNDIVLNPIVANNTSEMAVTLQGTNANGTAITIEGTTGNPIMNNPDGSITTVDPDGNIVPYQEEETEIIEEEQTPLVNGKENQVNNSNETLFIAGGIVLVIIIAGLIYGIKTKKLIKFKNHS